MKEMIYHQRHPHERLIVCALNMQHLVNFSKALRYPNEPFLVTKPQTLRGLNDKEIIVIGPLAMNFNRYPRSLLYQEFIDQIKAMRSNRIWFIEDWA